MTGPGQIGALFSNVLLFCVPGNETWGCLFSCFITPWSDHGGSGDLRRRPVWSTRGTECNPITIFRKEEKVAVALKKIHFRKMKLLITVSISSPSLVSVSVFPLWSSDAKRGKYIVGIALLQSNRNARRNSLHSQINTSCTLKTSPFFSSSPVSEYCQYGLPGDRTGQQEVREFSRWAAPFSSIWGTVGWLVGWLVFALWLIAVILDYQGNVWEKVK